MNDIQKLREHLFATLEGLKDKENPMDLDRAKTVCQVSQTIINTAIAEVEFAKVNGSVDSSFFHKPGLPNNNQMTGPAYEKPSLPPKLETEVDYELELSEISSTGGKTKVTTAPNGQRIVQHQAA